MRYLIGGLGSVGRRHLRNLVALGETDVVLLRTGKSTLPAEDLAAFPVEHDLRAALARRPDAVIVSNPTALHLSIAIPAAEAGCHLLLEKPLSDSMDGLDDLRRAIERGGGRTLVGFQFRHHPTLRRAKALLDEGMLGRILSVRAHWGEHLPDWHPWEDYRESYAARRDLGGGVLRTLCHPFDYLRWMFGEVEEARGVVGEGLGLDVEVAAEIGLRFQSGLLAAVHLDYLQAPAEHSLSIVGDRGRLRWDAITGDLEAGSHSFPVPEGFGRDQLFLAEMKHFIDVVRGESASACTLEDGIRVQEILEAIASSARLPRLDRSRS